MSDVNPDVHQQALVAVFAASQELGLDLHAVAERANAIIQDENHKSQFLPQRDVEHAALEIALAYAKARGL